MNQPSPDDLPRDPGAATFLDRVRDLLDGRLAPDDAARLEADLAADPALAAEVERYREVHAFTVEGTVPAPHLSADDVLRDARPEGGRLFRLRPRVAAAAAILVALSAIGLSALLRSPEPRLVELAALHAPGSPAPNADVPADAPALPADLAKLAAYEPLRDGSPNWLVSWDDANAVARSTRKAMLVFVFHPTCPVCRGMDATTFRATDVQTSLAELVPVRIDVTTAPEEIQRRLAEGKKWPYVAAVEGDGTTLEDLSGIWDLDDLPSRFAAADHAVRRADPERPTWADVRAAAADLIAAETAEKEGRLGAAEEAAGRVARVAPDTLLADRAAWQVKKLDLAADEALARAADAAKSDVDAALRSVEQEAKRYEGSARGADFARVATAIRETGVFPALQEIRR